MSRPLHSMAGLHPARQWGFTLVEVLVALTLLSVIMLALGAALRTVGQSGERIDVRLTRSDDFRVAQAFIRSTMGRVSARKAVMSDQPGMSVVQFAAAADAASWVGIMPARYGSGGRHFFRLAVERVGNESALVIRFVPWADTPGFPDWSQAQSRVLASGLAEFALRYEDARRTPSVWAPEWVPKDRLPDHVSVTVVSAAGAWPVLVIPLRVLPLSGDNMGGFTIGGRV